MNLVKPTKPVKEQKFESYSIALLYYNSNMDSESVMSRPGLFSTASKISAAEALERNGFR